MKRPLADKRPFGPAFSQDGTDSFRGKKSVIPGNGVYRLLYRVKSSDKDSTEVQNDVESAINAKTGEVRGSISELDIVVNDIIVDPAGFAGIQDNPSDFNVEILFFPDIQGSIDQFSVNQSTISTITEQVESIPQVSVKSEWELDFLITK